MVLVYILQYTGTLLWFVIFQVRSRGLPDDFEGTEVRVVEIEGNMCVWVCLHACECVCVCVCVHACVCM